MEEKPGSLQPTKQVRKRELEDLDLLVVGTATTVDIVEGSIVSSGRLCPSILALGSGVGVRVSKHNYIQVSKEITI